MATGNPSVHDRIELLNDKQEALLCGEGRRGSRRSIIAEEMQEMFERCYGNGVNPLPDIRKSYPEFSWEFWGMRKLQVSSVRMDIADESFFVWFITGYGIVGAKYREAHENRVLFLAEGSETPTIAMLSRIRFLSKLEIFANQ